jgi:hypothetical protein
VIEPSAVLAAIGVAIYEIWPFLSVLSDVSSFLGNAQE